MNLLGGAAIFGVLAGFWGHITEVLCMSYAFDDVTMNMPLLFSTPIDELVKIGEGDTGAQFQERCSMLAMKLFWQGQDDSNLNGVEKNG